MAEKAKRKGNPRRRLLVKIMVMIAIIATGAYSAWTMLQPTGAQIVYIAPDDKGQDQLWLADIDNPEHPRQVSHFDGDSYLRKLQATIDSHMVAIEVRDRDIDTSKLYHLNLKTGHLQEITSSYVMYWDLHPDGTRIVYSETDGSFKFDTVTIYDSRTREHTLIELEVQAREIFQWTGDGSQILVNTFDDNTQELTITLHDVSNLDRFIAVPVPSMCYGRAISPDTNRCARTIWEGIDLGSRLYVYDFATGEDTIFPTVISSETSEHMTVRTTEFRAWSPDSTRILAIDYYNKALDETFIRSEMSLYDVDSLTRTTISTSDSHAFYEWVDFDASGTKVILALDETHQGYRTEYQLVVYDLVSGEEIPLPISGRQAQWVNGG